MSAAEINLTDAQRSIVKQIFMAGYASGASSFHYSITGSDDAVSVAAGQRFTLATLEMHNVDPHVDNVLAHMVEQHGHEFADLTDLIRLWSAP